MLLPNRIAVYVPSTVNVTGPDTAGLAERFTDEAATLLATLFGGFTILRAEGGWVSGGRLVKEPVTIVYAYCTAEQKRDGLAQVEALCQRIKAGMGQEAVALEVGSKLKLI